MTKDSVIHDKMNFYYKYREFSQTKDSIIKEKYLKDDEFVANAINYLDADELNSFFFFEHRSINPQLLDRIDIMKPLALKLFNSIQYSNLKHDLNAMIEIASQPGIHPMIICYVDPKIQNNIKFISRIIANTNAIDDFYDHSAASIGDSMMRYGDVIGEDVQTNPLFWEMLNAMMLKKNPKAKLFDTKKEIANAKEYFSNKEKEKFRRSLIDSNEANICVTLSKGDYFGGDNSYYVTFDYSTDKQMEYMNHIFNDELLPAFGNNPYRFKNGVETIVPYQIDEFGIYTDKMYKSKGVGGTNIPEALLYEFIRRLVEHDKCTVKCGDLTMKGEFSPELFEEMKANLDKEKSI